MITYVFTNVISDLMYKKNIHTEQ